MATIASQGWEARAPVGVLVVGALAVLGNAGYCWLHGLVHGVPNAGLADATAWAVKATSGWLMLGTLGAFAFRRKLPPFDGSRVHAHTALGVVLGVVCALVAIEWLMGRVLAVAGAETSLTLVQVAYHRLPLLVAASGALAWALLRRWPTGAPAASSPADESLEVLTGQGRAVVPLREVERFESYENYARVHATGGRTYLLRTTMLELERRLAPAAFVRVHRGMIVNRERVIERRAGAMLVLASGTEVKVGRKYRDAVRVNGSIDVG